MLEIILRMYLLIYLFDTGYGQHSDKWHFTAPNIARGRPAYQHPGDFNHKDASLAVDGITTFTNNLQYCSHTSQGRYNDFPRWTVVFDDFFNLTGIRIYNRDDSNRERLRNFTIKGQTKNGNQTIFTSKLDEHMQTVINITIDGTTSFKSITISLPGNRNDSFLTLCEVEVFALLCPGVNANGNVRASLSSGTFYQYDNHVYFSLDAIVTIRCNGKMGSYSYSIRCQTDRTYNDTFPYCSLQHCYQPQTLTYGHYDIQNYPVRLASQIRAVCNLGYIVQGNEYRTCKYGGFWSGPEPICVPVPCTRPTGAHILSLPTDTFSFNTKLTVNCDNGYEPISAYITCSHGGHWDKAAPYCRIKRCRRPAYIHYGRYLNISNSFEYGTVLQFVCDKGHTSNIPEYKTICTSTGQWNASPICTKQTCLVPDLLNGYYNTGTNNNLTRSPIHYGDIIIPKCINLFGLKVTDLMRQCMANGKLSGESPFCVPLCSTPNITNGIYVNETGHGGHLVYGQNERIFPMCNFGFELEFGDEYLTCQGNHTWKGHIATCKVPLCSTPNITNGIYVNETGHGGHLVYEQNERIFPLCNFGFELEFGDEYLTCQANHTWKGHIATCKAEQCNLNQLPMETNNIFVNQSNQLVKINANVLLQCKKGFEVTNIGNQQLRCNERKQFEGEPLICKRVEAETSNNEGRISKGEIGGIGGGLAVAMLVIAVLALLLYRMRKQRLTKTSRSNGNTLEPSNNNSSFTHHENKPEDEFFNLNETANANSEDHIYNTVTDDNSCNDKQNEEEECSHKYYNCTVEKITKICNASELTGRDGASR